MECACGERGKAGGLKRTHQGVQPRWRDEKLTDPPVKPVFSETLVLDETR